MDLTTTLTGLSEKKDGEVGKRSRKYEGLFSRGVSLPPMFIILHSAFERFKKENGIHERMGEVTSTLELKKGSRLKEACEEVEEMMMNSQFSEKLSRELRDSYNTLSVDGEDAEDLLSSKEKPLILMLSPNYSLKEWSEGSTELVQGKESFLEAVKRIWTLLYSPEMVEKRRSQGLRKDVKTSVIVQSVGDCRGVCEVESRPGSSDKITVKAYSGYPNKDLGDEEKDVFVLDREYLTIQDTTIRTQTEKKVFHKEKGGSTVGISEEKQKIQEKNVMESALLLKKAEKTFSGKARIVATVSEESGVLLNFFELLEEDKEYDIAIEDVRERDSENKSGEEKRSSEEKEKTGEKKKRKGEKSRREESSESSPDKSPPGDNSIFSDVSETALSESSKGKQEGEKREPSEEVGAEEEKTAEKKQSQEKTEKEELLSWSLSLTDSYLRRRYRKHFEEKPPENPEEVLKLLREEVVVPFEDEIRELFKLDKKSRKKSLEEEDLVAVIETLNQFVETLLEERKED